MSTCTSHLKKWPLLSVEGWFLFLDRIGSENRFSWDVRTWWTKSCQRSHWVSSSAFWCLVAKTFHQAMGGYSEIFWEDDGTDLLNKSNQRDNWVKIEWRCVDLEKNLARSPKSCQQTRSILTLLAVIPPDCSCLAILATYWCHLLTASEDGCPHRQQEHDCECKMLSCTIHHISQVPKDFPLHTHHTWPLWQQRGGRPMVTRGWWWRGRDGMKLHKLRCSQWALNCCNIANQDIRW